MKILKSFIKAIVLIIASLILSLGIYILITIIQTKLFVPKDYIIWIFKSPYSKLILIYQYLITYGLLHLFNKNFDSFKYFHTHLINKFTKKSKSYFLYIFVIFNLILAYRTLYNVSVITDTSIIDYSFLSPMGKEYSFNDIKNINTGVYGKKGFTYSKGDFYYIIELKDGTKIDLNEMAGSKNDEDHRFTIEKLDIQYVNMGIDKISSMDNFEYTTEHLAEIYTDKIRSILLNVK